MYGIDVASLSWVMVGVTTGAAPFRVSLHTPKDVAFLLKLLIIQRRAKLQRDWLLFRVKPLSMWVPIMSYSLFLMERTQTGQQGGSLRIGTHIFASLLACHMASTISSEILVKCSE